MPIVTVNMMEGRDPERIQEMIAEVSKAISHSLDAPIESIRVIVNEMEPHQYGIAGRPAGEVMAERRAAPSDPQTATPGVASPPTRAGDRP